MHELLFLLALAFLTYAAAYTSAAEISLFSLPSAKVKAFKSDRDPRKKLISKLLSRPRDLLVTIFILNSLVNILLQNVASSMFGVDSGWTMRIGVPLFLTLIIGEILPKYFALQENVSIAKLVAPSIDFFTRLLTPIRNWTVKVTTPISQLMFFFLKKEEPISNEELQHVLKTSKESGVLDEAETTFIAGYLALQDSQAKELMRPREEILYYNIEDPLSKLLHLFADEQCTRLPVCRKNLDDTLGIISADQYLIHRDKIADEPEKLLPFLKIPLFVPESTPSRLLLRRFEDQQEYLALIVNEYGVISGLISREDLVEEVVGDISDQRDQNAHYTLTAKQVMIANGKLELSEFEDVFGVHLESPNNMLTIGGWIQEYLGEIPKSGFQFETDQLYFHILSAEPNRIKNVYIRKKQSSTRGKA